MDVDCRSLACPASVESPVDLISILCHFQSPGKDSNMSSDDVVKVGSTIRAQFGSNNVRRKAVVATVQDDEVCVIWEDEAPRPIQPSKEISFIVTPTFKTFNRSEDEAETTVPRESIAVLLPFETELPSVDGFSQKSAPLDEIFLWKERGDSLLRLGDASAAATFYEMSLRLSSPAKPSIGSTVVVKIKGFTKLAEIDCTDDSDGTVDITMCGTGDEKTVKGSDILLSILDGDESERLQERILLNLTRCLLQLSEVTTDFSRRSSYLRSAVLACSLSLAADEFHPSDSVSPTQKTALLLRSRSQIARSKLPNATADIKRLLSLDPDNKEGKRVLRDIERLKLQQQKSDKKLVKELCQWVNKATDGTVSEQDDRSKPHESSSPSRKVSVPRMNEDLAPHPRFVWFLILVVVVIAWVWQNAL